MHRNSMVYCGALAVASLYPGSSFINLQIIDPCMALGTGTHAELTPQISVMMVNSSPFSQPQHSRTFQHREHRKEMAVIPLTFD